MKPSTKRSDSSRGNGAEIVCFGIITPALVVAVDEVPAVNTGALIHEAFEFVGSDAANIACMLRKWDVRSGHIGTALGDDPRGHLVARYLRDRGVLGEMRFRKDLTTPYEIDVSDKTGARTFFWKRDAEVLKTLETADLSLLDGARLLYVDWYDGDAVLRAMDEANHRGVEVFLNFEHGHEDPEVLARYAGRATICQVVTDEAQTGAVDPKVVARKLLKAGVETVLVTLAKEGCLAMSENEVVRAWPPAIEVVDGCCAGAIFSAGCMYGRLLGWSLLETVRFATTAATFTCTKIGPQIPSIDEIESLSKQVRAAGKAAELD